MVKYILPIRFMVMTFCYRCPVKMTSTFLTKVKLKYIVIAILLILVMDFFGAFTHIFETDYYTEFSYPLDIDVREQIDSLRNGQKPSIEPINEYPFRYKISNAAKCKERADEKEHKNIILLYMIKSALDHKPQRDTIRKTWGYEKRFSDVEMRRVFLLGVDQTGTISQDHIDEENRKNGDIVQADFFDTYFNNTIKTMMGFKWVVTHCSKTQFILLVDDDMYVSAKNLLKFLRNPLDLKMVESRNKFEASMSDHKSVGGKWWGIYEESQEKPIYDGRLYAGHVFFSSPQRHKSSKWFITLNEYQYSLYPPYVTAGVVALSFPALLDMYYASFFTKHFRFDDIYMGILAKKTGIHPIENSNIHYHKKSYSPESYSNVIASHGYGNPYEMLQRWEEQKSLGNT